MPNFCQSFMVFHLQMSSPSPPAGRKKVEGLHSFHLDNSLFVEIGKHMGMQLRSWRQLPLEDGSSGANTLANQSKVDKETDQIYGHLAFELFGTCLKTFDDDSDEGNDADSDHDHGRHAAALGSSDDNGDGKKDHVTIGAHTSMGPYGGAPNDDNNEDKENHGDVITCQVILRSKMAGVELLSVIADIFRKKLSPQEGQLYISIVSKYIQGNEVRDVLIAKAAMSDPVLQAIMPKVFYVKSDPEKKLHFFVMERFNEEGYSHIDCIEGGKAFGKEEWGPVQIQQVLAGMATVHARFLNNIQLLPPDLRSYLKDFSAFLVESADYLRISASKNMERNPDLCTAHMRKTIHKIASNANIICEVYNSYPKTLAHYDFSPRNCCLRRSAKAHQRPLCLYDWEIASIHVPQADVVHFLAFALGEVDVFNAISTYAEFYQKCLLTQLQLNGCNKETLQVVGDVACFQKVFDFAMMDFLAHRVMMYQSYVHAFTQPLPFVPRIGNVAMEYVNATAHRYAFLSD